MANDPIVAQLQTTDEKARTAYRCTAARFFTHFVAWENLTMKERDYWRYRVL